MELPPPSVGPNIGVNIEEFKGILNYQGAEQKLPSKPPPFCLPQGTPRFTGRVSELKRLAELLLQAGQQRTAAIVGVTGQGGIGKSALAFHFAEQYKASFPDGIIGERVNGKDADTIVRTFARLADEEITDDEARPGAAVLMRKLFAHRRMLLIFDNAERTADIRNLHPGGKCAVIITTRDRSLPGWADVPDEQCVDLPFLSDQEAKDLLASFIGHASLDAEPEAVTRILELVGNLPLALEIVGKSLQHWRRRKPSFRLAEYAENLNLERLSARPDDPNLNVRICFEQSIKLLSEYGQTAFARLSACAQGGFALRTAMAAMGITDEFAAEEQLFQLVDLSLLNQVQTDKSRFIFHPLLHEFAGELAKKCNMAYLAKRLHANYLIEQLRSQELDELAADVEDFVRVAEWLNESEDESYVGFYLQLQSLFERLGHWQRAAKIISQFIRLAEIKQDWLQVVLFNIQQAKFTLWQGNFHKAEELLLAVTGIIQKSEPPEQRQRTESMRLNTLGGVYLRKGEFDKAVQVFQQSAAIEEQLGNQYGQAVVLNSLGSAYQRQGKWNESVATFTKSYELSVAVDDQRGQAMILNSLGGVWQRMGKFDEAVQVFKQSGELEEKLNNQRGQAMVLNSLGGVYQRQGKFDDAVLAFKQSYDLLVLLQDERGQAMVLNSLGGVYQRQGKFDDAVLAFKQSYDISARLEDERGQAMVLNSLGGVYQRQGKFDDAVLAFRQSANIGEALGDQRHFAMALNSLGGVYQRQGKFDDAVLAFRQGYDISSRLEDERSLAMVLNSLGGVYQRQGKFDDAVLAFKQSYDISARLEDERGQAMVLNSLGGVYQLKEKFAEATQFFAKSVAIGEKLNDHRHLAMVCTAWGRALLRQHQPTQALAQLQRGFSIDAQIKNKRGMEIVTPLLCQALRQLGRHQEAAACCQRALSIAPGNAKLLALEKSLQQPLLTGTIKLIKPSRDGGHSFGYITMDDCGEDVRFDSRYVDISDLSKGTLVAVEIITDSWGKRIARQIIKK